MNGQARDSVFGLAGLGNLPRIEIRAEAANQVVPVEFAFVDDLEERIWLDRRELANAFRAPAARAGFGWMKALRQFVVRMQLGPLPPAGTECSADLAPSNWAT